MQILGLKFTKLEEMIKSKDRQIEELVKKIKSKGLTWICVWWINLIFVQILINKIYFHNNIKDSYSQASWNCWYFLLEYLINMIYVMNWITWGWQFRFLQALHQQNKWIPPSMTKSARSKRVLYCFLNQELMSLSKIIRFHYIHLFIDALF